MSPLPVEISLMSTRLTEKTMAAPERLDLESRTAFRRAAGEVLDQLAEGTGRLIIDLSGTRSIDSAGLGALMLIQRKASERRQVVCLRGAKIGRASCRESVEVEAVAVSVTRNTEVRDTVE